MCLYPLSAFRSLNTLTGETSVRVSRSIPKHDDNFVFDELLLPCGKCIECQQDKTKEWSFRIMDEASKYEHNCCLTLTYNDEFLPADLSLVKRDYQLFLKHFRKHVQSVRYFGCGEYGGKFLRPHYHIILFGYDPPDKYFWCKSKSGEDLYRSPIVEASWCDFSDIRHPKSRGFSYVGDLDLRTAKYCAKYLQKYLFQTDSRLVGKRPPFVFMSTHPGIGGDFVKCLSTDKLYKASKWVKTPRYYLKQAEAAGIDLTSLKANRRLKSYMLQRSVADLKRHRKIFEKTFKKSLDKFL